MSMIADILERLSGIEVVKERLRETGARVEQWAAQTVALDRQVQDIETVDRGACATGASHAGHGKRARIPSRARLDVENWNAAR